MTALPQIADAAIPAPCWHPSEHDIEIVRRLYPQGGSRSCLPHLSGGTAAQVRQLARKLHLRTQASAGGFEAWDAQQDALLREHYMREGAKWCARRMPGRSLNAVKKRACALGLKTRRFMDQASRAASHHPAIDDAIRAGWGRLKRGRFSVADLAREIGRDAPWVRRRAAALGLVNRTSKEPPWSAAEIAILRENADLRPRHIAVELRKAGFVRSSTGVAVKRQRLALHPFDDRLHASALAELLGVTGTTVRRWIEHNDLPARRVSDAWIIDEKKLRAWVSAHRSRIDLRHVDQEWFMNLCLGPRPAGVSVGMSAQEAA